MTLRGVSPYKKKIIYNQLIEAKKIHLAMLASYIRHTQLQLVWFKAPIRNVYQGTCMQPLTSSLELEAAVCCCQGLMQQSFCCPFTTEARMAHISYHPLQHQCLPQKPRCCHAAAPVGYAQTADSEAQGPHCEPVPLPPSSWTAETSGQAAQG